jgi:acetolactate synthase-1/2/3 large subunit
MYGTIGMHHEMRYPGRPYVNATRLTNPDFAMWARSFGAEGITLTDPADVPAAVGRAFAVKDKPVVLHVHTSADQMSAWRRRG